MGSLRREGISAPGRSVGLSISNFPLFFFPQKLCRSFSILPPHFNGSQIAIIPKHASLSFSCGRDIPKIGAQPHVVRLENSRPLTFKIVISIQESVSDSVQPSFRFLRTKNRVGSGRDGPGQNGRLHGRGTAQMGKREFSFQRYF